MAGNVTANHTGQIWLHDIDATVWFTLVFLSILSLSTVIANGFALYVVYRDPLKVFRSPMAVLLTGLLVSDFLTGLVVEPIFAYAYSRWFTEAGGEDEHMKLVRSAQVLCAVTINTSFLTMLAMAVVQLLAVKAPGVFLRSVTSRGALIALVLIWVYAIIFSLVPEIFDISLVAFYAVDLVLHPLALTFSLVVIYIVTYCAFHQSRSSYEASPESPSHAKQAGQVEREFLKGTLLLIMLLVLTVWPYSIMLGLFCFHPGWWITLDLALVICDDILFLKFLLDPFVFVWRMPKYRKAAILVFREIREMLGLSPKSLPNASYHHTDKESSESDLGQEADAHPSNPSLTLHL